MVYLLITSLLPTIIVTIIWWRLFTSHRQEIGRITTWPAMILASIGSSMGVWGLIHLSELRQRSFFDYRFERHASAISFYAFVAALAWLFRSRNFCSWTAVAVSLGMSAVWTAACMTL